ncbi:MAG: threonine synthase, partial [Anaerolineales bacterium]
MNSKFMGYRCSICKADYAPGEVTYTCPRDGGNLDVVLDYETLKKKGREKLVLGKEPSLWRYQPLLPVPDPQGYGTPLRAAGWTPVFSPIPLARKLN